MFSEENIMNTLIGGSMLAGCAGIIIVGIWQGYRDEHAMKKRRKEVQRGVNNYARLQAKLATSSQVIQRGSFLKRVIQYYPYGRG